MSAPEWLTVKEVAEAWREKPRAVTELIREKKLRATKVGRQWLVRPADKAAYEQARSNVTEVRRRTSRPKRRAA